MAEEWLALDPLYCWGKPKTALHLEIVQLKYKNQSPVSTPSHSELQEEFKTTGETPPKNKKVSSFETFFFYSLQSPSWRCKPGWWLRSFILLFLKVGWALPSRVLLVHCFFLVCLLKSVKLFDSRILLSPVLP